jgi:Zn-dependent protease with chaperone function
VSVYLCVGIIVDIVVAGISFETEAKLFSAMTPDTFASSLGKTDSKDERLERVQRVLDKFTVLPDVPPLKYRLVVIGSPEKNAFAFPGGTIGVTDGLLKALDEDIELAFVLGHEIGHFYGRDHLRGLGRAVGVSLAYAIIFGGDMGNEYMGTTFQYVLGRGYSRRQESKADEFGVKLVYEAYGRTDGVERLFKILEESKDLPEWAYMFSTHPAPGKRVRELMQYSRQMTGQ